MTNVQTPLKKCSRCGNTKPLSEFALRSSAAKGLVERTYCQTCDVPQNMTKEQNRRKALMARYHLTPEKFQEMGEDQHWRCAICFNDITFAPYIDHNHATGAVRLLLCFHCNIALGHIKDNIDVARSIVQYLENHYVHD